jgi:AraC-like DNA-binding protein
MQSVLNLDRILDGLDVEVAPFKICEIREGASLLIEDHRDTSLHYVLAGEGTVRLPTGAEIPLRPHTVVVAPPGARLTVTHGGATALPVPHCRPLPGGWERATIGEGKLGVMLACGLVEAVHRQTTGLFEFLRAPLVERVDDEPAFREPFHRLLRELAAPMPGTRALAQALMKECLIVLLRRHIDDIEDDGHWLAALSHPQLGRALAAMTDQPRRAYTLQDLADLAGMSRTAFADAFKASFGQTPMSFLATVRLRRGADLLATTDLPVKTVAGRSGFASRSHFSRAFKAIFGVSPADYRAPPAEAAPPDQRSSAIKSASPSA